MLACSGILLAPAAASGTSLERFLEVLASVPDAERAVAPNCEEFEHYDDPAARTTIGGR
jgi:hypothetical protein